MPDYRCYRMDQDDHIVGVEIYDAPTDVAACSLCAGLAAAQRWFRFELWEENRRVNCDT